MQAGSNDSPDCLPAPYLIRDHSCQNIEQLITNALKNVALDQTAGGSGIFANAGVNNTGAPACRLVLGVLGPAACHPFWWAPFAGSRRQYFCACACFFHAVALAQYFLTGQGKNVTDIIQV